MKPARIKAKQRQEEPREPKDAPTVFRWTPDGLRCVEGAIMDVEGPPDAFAYGRSVGVRPKNRSDAINILKRGLPASSFEKLYKGLAISSSDLARITNIAIRTLQRRRKQGHFQTDESERLLRLGVLFDKAVEVLGGVDVARDWMKTPKKPLAGKTPLEYCDTEPGAREVEDLLGRIEHGVFS